MAAGILVTAVQLDRLTAAYVHACEGFIDYVIRCLQSNDRTRTNVGATIINRVCNFLQKNASDIGKNTKLCKSLISNTLISPVEILVVLQSMCVSVETRSVMYSTVIKYCVGFITKPSNDLERRQQQAQACRLMMRFCADPELRVKLGREPFFVPLFNACYAMVERGLNVDSPGWRDEANLFVAGIGVSQQLILIDLAKHESSLGFDRYKKTLMTYLEVGDAYDTKGNTTIVQILEIAYEIMKAYPEMCEDVTNNEKFMNFFSRSLNNENYHVNYSGICIFGILYSLRTDFSAKYPQQLFDCVMRFFENANSGQPDFDFNALFVLSVIGISNQEVRSKFYVPKIRKWLIDVVARNDQKAALFGAEALTESLP